MPCYHFTFHGYGTWLPDEDDGYVRRGRGLQPQDTSLAHVYRHRMAEEEVQFDDGQQRLLIDELLVASEKQSFRLHFAATEPTHLHVLVSWGDDRPWDKVRNGIKSSLTRRLNRECEKRKRRFSDSASRRRVSNEEHFDYLVTTYLPEHGGWKWRTNKGLHRNSEPAP